MSRYIDADDALELLNLMYDNQEDKDDPYNVGVMGAINYIKHKAPSIDIVRCSECVYCNVQNTKYLYAICERHGIEFKPFEDDTRTHGCAWGISRSEKPNNCEYAKNPSGDVWECGCFLDTYCEHQIYDRNPDGTINIVECGYEPEDEPQTERSSE